MSFNEVTTYDQRLNPAYHDTYSFFKVDAGAVWHSHSYHLTQRVSTDGGKKYEDVTEEIIFGSFFFLSNIRAEHTRKLYNILNLLTEIGGIQATMYAFINMIGTYFNT